MKGRKFEIDSQETTQCLQRLSRVQGLISERNERPTVTTIPRVEVLMKLESISFEHTVIADKTIRSHMSVVLPSPAVDHLMSRDDNVHWVAEHKDQLDVLRQMRGRYRMCFVNTARLKFNVDLKIIDKTCRCPESIISQRLIEKSSSAPT